MDDWIDRIDQMRMGVGQCQEEKIWGGGEDGEKREAGIAVERC